jgi:hypothetical protein
MDDARVSYTTSLVGNDSPDNYVNMIKSDARFLLVVGHLGCEPHYEVIGPINNYEEYNFKEIESDLKKRAIKLGIYSDDLVSDTATNIYKAQMAENAIREGTMRITFVIGDDNTQINIALDILSKYDSQIEECMDVYAAIRISSLVDALGLFLQQPIEKRRINRLTDMTKH